MSLPKLNFMTSLSKTGYGIAGLNIALELNKISDLYVHPHGQVMVNSPLEGEILKELCIKGANKFPYNAPCLNLWHQFDLAKRVGSGEYYVYPFFELDKFTDKEKHHLNCADHIIVASEWAQDIIEKEVGRTSYVIPLGVDPTIFYPSEIDRDDEPYIFFNAGKWEKRKGHDFLWRAFDAAFEKDDDVELKMMPHNPFLNPAQVQQFKAPYQKAKLADKITIIPPVSTHREVSDIMIHTDCGVFPSRAEGWNMELHEMMACGKPVIATNYSAHTEYCNEGNCRLIDIDDVEEAYDGIWFTGQGNWAEFEDDQFDQLVEHMRYMYDERPANPVGVTLAHYLSWKRTAKELIRWIGII